MKQKPVFSERNEAEIRKAERELKDVTVYDSHLTKIVFWSAIFVIVLGNIIAAFVLIPLFVTQSAVLLYGTVIVLAGLIGFLYNFLIRDIAQLQKKHHITAGIIIPLIALTNIAIIAQRFPEGGQNPLLIGILFAAVFILPSVGSWIGRKKNRA